MIYGFVNDDRIPLTIENILLRVSQKDIFESIVGEKIEIDKYYHSLVREADNNPSCYFTWFGDKLLFIDFAYKKQQLDCFGVISEKYKISLQESLSLVNLHFKLGLNGTGNPSPIKFPKINFQKTITNTNNVNIIFKPRPFNLTDIEYWSQYDITIEDLTNEKVYPILWYKFYSFKLNKMVIVRPKTITYAFYEFQPFVKIYSPYLDKKKGKWVTNVTSNHIGGLQTIKTFNEKLIITKSLKDKIVIKNFGIDAIWFQSENIYPSHRPSKAV